MLSFYGVSVSQIAMMTPNPRRIRALVKLINSPLSNRIKSTKITAKYLKAFFNELPKGYNDPQARMLMNRIKGAGATSNISSTAFGSLLSAPTKSKEDYEKELAELVAQKGLKEELTNSFLDNDKQRVSLSEPAFHFLKKYQEKFSRNLDLIESSCVEGVLSEIKIFGRSPSSLFNKPQILEYSVINLFTKKNEGRVLPVPEILRRIAKELETCKKIIKDFDNSAEENRMSREGLLESLSPSEFQSFILTKGLSEKEVDRLESLYLNNYPVLMSGLNDAITRNSLKQIEVGYLSSFYFELYLLDSPEYITKLMEFDDTFGDVDIQSIYSELNNIGLVYLNMVNVKFFLQELKQLVLGEEEAVVNIDTVGDYGKTFRQVVDQLELGFMSLNNSGSKLEGVS